MHARPRFIAGALAACGVVFAYQALAVSFSTPNATNSECEAVRLWGTSYIASHPAPTLEDLARFDQAHRVAVFGAATPDVRAALMQDQLRRLDQSPDLSEMQHRVIADALVLMTPALYAQEPAAQASMARLKPRIVEAFPLTGPHARGWLELASVVPGANALARAPNCNCNIASGTCACASASCTPSFPGCGWGASEWCNGRCQ